MKKLFIVLFFITSYIFAEDVEGNLEFVNYLIKTYNDPFIQPRYDDPDWNEKWQFYIFREEACNDGVVNCQDRMISFIKENLDTADSIKIIWGHYKGIKETRYRHVWVEIDGIQIDPNPNNDLTDATISVTYTLK